MVVRGMEPAKPGPYLIAANHISHFDPPALGGFYARQVDFLAMKDLFSTAFGNYWFTTMGCIPVDREGSETKAIREALKRLKEGRIMGIFPEAGLRTKEESVLAGVPLPTGAAFIAQKANVAVRPCLVVGMDQFYVWKNFFRKVRVFFIFGPYLELNPDLPAKQARQDLNDRIHQFLMDEYQKLVKEEGLSDIEIPQTAQERWKRGR